MCIWRPCDSSNCLEHIFFGGQHSGQMWMMFGISEFSPRGETFRHSSLPVDIHSEGQRNSSVLATIHQVPMSLYHLNVSLLGIRALVSGKPWLWNQDTRMVQCCALLSPACNLDRPLNLMIKFAQWGNEHGHWSQPDDAAQWVRKERSDIKSWQSQSWGNGSVGKAFAA